MRQFIRVCMVAAFLLGAGQANGQDPKKSEDTEEVKTEETPAAKLEALKAEVAKLEQELKKATGENQAIAAEQLDEKRTELINVLDESLDGALGDPAALALAKGLVNSESKRLKKKAKELERDLKKLFTTLGKLEGGELVEAEETIAAAGASLDATLKALLVNTERQAKLEVPSADDLAFLDSELKERAERLAGTIGSTLESIDTLSKREVATDDDKKKLKDEISGFKSRLDSAVASLKKTVELMKQRKLETADYQQLIIEATGDISTDILDAEVALGLVDKYLGQAKTWFVERGPIVLFKLLLAFLIIGLAKLLARLVRPALRLALGGKKHESDLLSSLVVGIAGKAVVLAGVLVALWQLGLSPAPMLAGLGIAGLVIGLALQDTLSSVASGAMILIYRPFDKGDLVETNGNLGVVKEMNLMATTLLTPANERVMIPNNKIWGDVIKNFTGEPHRRVDMVFGISYTDDMDQAKAILETILDEHDRVLSEPKPIVRVHELADSSVNFIVRPFSKPEDYWDVFWDVTHQVKARFDKDGVSIPFPQRDVHLFRADEADKAA